MLPASRPLMAVKFIFNNARAIMPTIISGTTVIANPPASQSKPSWVNTVLKMNFTVLSGLLAGSVTDPPALAFANNLAKSDAPTVAYATVYPLTMLLRIVTVQILVLVFCR